MALNPTYLEKHHTGGFRYQRSVPRDLRARLGRKLIREYIGDVGHGEALRQARAFAVRDDKRFANARALSPDRVAQLEKDGGLYKWENLEEGWAIQASMVGSEPTAATIAWIAKHNGMTELEAELWCYRSNAQHQEQLRESRELIERVVAVAREVEPPAPPNPEWSLDALYTLWLKKGWKITRKHAATLALLKAFLPDARDFRTIPPQDIWRFQEHLSTLGLKWSSQHNHLKNLRGLFSAAIPRYRKDNPAAGIKPDGQPHKSNKEAFTGAQLRHVLSLAANRKFGRNRHIEVMWLIKLAIYTGARVNELAQLRKPDVFSKPVPYIHIREGGNGQSVKTGKARKVPLHSAVAGFVNFALASKTDFIFDVFPDDDVNHRAGWLIANFGPFLRKVCDITDRNITLHSTRHRFTDAGRNAGISEQRIKELKDGVKGYGSGTDIRELAKSVELMNPLAD